MSTIRTLGQPKTVGELKRLIENYNDDTPFSFRNQPMQELVEEKIGYEIFVRFEEPCDKKFHTFFPTLSPILAEYTRLKPSIKFCSNPEMQPYDCENYKGCHECPLYIDVAEFVNALKTTDDLCNCKRPQKSKLGNFCHRCKKHVY